MSHFTDVDIQVRDLDALQAACQELDLGFEANAQARGYASNSTPGDFVIRLTGPYDIAVNRQSDGTFTPVKLASARPSTALERPGTLGHTGERRIASHQECR